MTRWILPVLVCLWVQLLGGQNLVVQSPSPYQVISGRVVSFSGKRLTIKRTVRGQGVFTRRFVMDRNTKIEGKLAGRSRVTVGYVNEEGVDVAVRVIIRAPRKSSQEAVGADRFHLPDFIRRFFAHPSLEI